VTGGLSYCHFCGGKRGSGTTTFTAELGFGVVVIRNVPEAVGGQCGEARIEDRIAAMLEKHVDEAREQRQQAAVFAT